MFDWFAPAAAEQQAEINKPGNVAELMKETEFVDEDGNGVDDNFEQWVEETRAGTVTRSKYSKYLVAENNRQAVAEMKRVAEEKESMRQAMTNKFQEAAKKNVKESRMQRARALSMVRRHKDEMAQRGTSTKEQIAAAKQLAEEKQLLENQQNAQLAIELGKQQRERLQQNRDETLKEQQQAARALKEEGKEKVAARLAAEQAILESKQRKAKTIKEQTRPEVTAASKFFFYSQRKNTADDVRESVKSWGEEVEQERGNTLAKIKQKNHHSARADPAEGVGKVAAWREQLLQERKQAAEAKREAFRAVVTERDERKWNEGLKAREAHLKHLQERFVDPETSAIVEGSSYEQVSTAHISQAGSQASSRSAEGSPGAGRGPWSPSAKSSGWFSSWFAGPEIKQTTI